VGGGGTAAHLRRAREGCGRRGGLAGAGWGLLMTQSAGARKARARPRADRNLLAAGWGG
jgi:hypothetical protein